MKSWKKKKKKRSIGKIILQISVHLKAFPAVRSSETWWTLIFQRPIGNTQGFSSGQKFSTTEENFILDTEYPVIYVKTIKIEHASLLSLLTEKEKLVSQSFIQKHGGFFIISVFPIKISRKTTFLSLNIKNGLDAGITGICIRPSEAEATVLCSDTQKNVNYHWQLELSAFISAL